MSPGQIAKDLLDLRRQEEALRFETFDFAVADRIATFIKEAARERGLPIAFDVSAGDTVLHYATMAGGSPDNAVWIQRKKRVVARFHKSSYAFKLELDLSGADFEKKWGASLSDYALSGGSFPIRILACPWPVGSVTVSGLPQREDHNLVVWALSKALNLDPGATALGSIEPPPV